MEDSVDRDLLRGTRVEYDGSSPLEINEGERPLYILSFLYLKYDELLDNATSKADKANRRLLRCMVQFEYDKTTFNRVNDDNPLMNIAHRLDHLRGEFRKELGEGAQEKARQVVFEEIRSSINKT